MAGSKSALVALLELGFVALLGRAVVNGVLIAFGQVGLAYEMPRIIMRIKIIRAIQVRRFIAAIPQVNGNGAKIALFGGDKVNNR